jgi:hypothetical protein
MKTRLIALTLILAAMVPSIGKDIEADRAFEVPPDEAEPLLTQGLAKLADPAPSQASAPKSAKTVKVRVLADCTLGRANDVVTLTAAEAKLADEQGLADPSKEAVAYAATLEQNQPAA